ncbi:MAG TPA: ABC transporter ATP-binding protein [Roseimicrobium sp.]|nr:ABC transporter ATP-binding protein [Roseimicrobium sp.]
MKTSLKVMMQVIATLWRLRPHLRGGRYLVGVVVGTSFVGALLEGVGVSMLVPLLSLLLGGENAVPMRPIRWLQTTFPGHTPQSYVLILCGLVFFAIACKNAILYSSTVLAARLKRRIGVNLRDGLFQRIHRAELSLFEQKTVGELSNVCFGETSRTFGAIDLMLVIGQRVTMVTFYIALLLVISWQLTIIAVGLSVLIGMSVGFVHRHIRMAGFEITTANEKLGSVLFESFAGVRVIRATHSQERVKERFHELNQGQAGVEERMTRYSGMLFPFTETVAVIGGMTIIGSGYGLYVKPGTMLASHLLGFGFILLRMLPLLNQIYGLLGHMQYLAPGVSAVEYWLNQPEFPHRPFGTREFQGSTGRIRFENVSYTYPNGTVALQEIVFDVPSGKTVALVGSSGSGKSTLATLLLRLRQPTGGKILIDGTDYWDFSANSWHRQVSVVEQEAFLFHDTLAKNIAYGRPEATPAEIRQAVQQAYLEDVVSELPEGLDTIIGERGVLLSGGQRQRLAIARALVRNPKLLILDEATSALDNLSEREVQAALERAVTGRTVVVIAHRLSTIRHADHIVVLDKGRVIEQGSWDELIALGGQFEKMAQQGALVG